MSTVIITPKKSMIILKAIIRVGVFFILPILLLLFLKEQEVVTHNDLILMAFLTIIFILPFVYYFIEILGRIKWMITSKKRGMVLYGTILNIILFGVYVATLVLLF